MQITNGGQTLLLTPEEVEHAGYLHIAISVDEKGPEDHFTPAHFDSADAAKKAALKIKWRQDLIESEFDIEEDSDEHI